MATNDNTERGQNKPLRRILIGVFCFWRAPPSPNPEGMDDDDGDPLWLVDDIFEGWDEEDDEIPYAPYNDDDDDWGDVLEYEDLPGYVDIENAKWDDGRDEKDGGEDSGTLKDGDLKYLKLSSGDNGNANVNSNQDVEVVSSNQTQGNSVVLDRGRIYIYTTNNRKIELVEGKDYYYKNGTAYYYNQPYNAVAYRLGQGNITFNASSIKGQSTITVKRNNNKDYTLYEGKDYYIGSDNKAYFYSNVRSVNEAEGNSVTAPDENGIVIETDDGRVSNTEDYFIGEDGKAYYLYGPPAPYGDEKDKTGGTVYAIASTDSDRLNDEQQKANAQYIYDYLSNEGWSREAICGLLGNIQQESRLNPGVWQSLNKTSLGYGLVQWDDGIDFLNWAKLDIDDANEMAENDPKQLIDLQLEFLIWSSLSTSPIDGRRWYATTNYRSPYKMTYKEYITSTKDVGELALVFHGSYERSADDAKGLQERVDDAEMWYEYFSK